VLNKELQKAGGRTLIRLGSEDIDFSPKFFIILTTRNPAARFAPDLCSRVTLVNFTVTPASLEAQTLSAILKMERPDVDHRRTEVLRLQGEQSVKLRELEAALLSRISAVQGAILDDDSVIKALEQIKSEAAELQQEAAQTQNVLEEVKTVSGYYEPLATAMATVYFAMEGLAVISPLYQLSLHLFLEIVSKVLKPSNSGVSISSDAKVTAGRVKELSFAFFAEVSRRVLICLRLEDKLMFLVRLGQIATLGQPAKSLTTAEADILYRGSVTALDVDLTKESKYTKLKSIIPGYPLDDATAKQLFTLTLLPSFSGLIGCITSASKDVLKEIMEGSSPEKIIPVQWVSDKADITSERCALLRIMLVRVLRPECTLRSLEEYVNVVFSSSFDWREHSRPDLRVIIELDSKASRPVMICSEPGQDASGKVDSLATTLGKPLLQVAMGSAEGFVEADRCIAQALKLGSWVILRNVHLCIEWLSGLEKRINTFTPHPDFRLFLTCEIHPSLPTALLRLSDVVVAEALTGMKANILRFYNSIPVSRMDKAPAERFRLYSLLCWLNAVVQERRRYTPLGWTKRYEFSEADAFCALDVIDEWLDNVSGTGDGRQRAHIDPEAIPWEALRTLLCQSLYGGRVDVLFDQV
jgi:dynein heavy chain 1